MSLQTRLALAFFLLAVVPLAAVTLHSYVSSERAFREAVALESAALAEDMRGRMDAIVHSLRQRMARLGHVPAPVLAGPQPAEDDPETARFLREVERTMGEDAHLVRELVFLPRPPEVPAPAAPAAPAVPAAAPEAPKPARTALLLLAPPDDKAAKRAKARWVIRQTEQVAEHALAAVKEDLSAQDRQELEQAQKVLRSLPAWQRRSSSTRTVSAACWKSWP